MTNKMCTAVVLGALVGAAAGCGDLKEIAVQAFYVRYTPNGSLVVYAGDAIDVYSADLTTKQASIPIPALPNAPPSYSSAFALSDDGTTAAVSVRSLPSPSVDDQIALFSLPGGESLPAIELGPLSQNVGEAEDLALSPHGDLLYVTGPINDLYRQTGVFDTGSSALLWSRDWTVTPVFSPDGATVYAAGDQGQDLFGFDARTGAIGLDVPVPSFPDLIAMADPQTLIARSGYAFQLLSTEDGSLVRQLFQLNENTALSGTTRLGLPAARCSVTVGLCAVAMGTVDPATMIVNGYGVQIWNMDGTLLGMVQTQANDVAISPDGLFLAIADLLDVKVFRISDGVMVGSRHYADSLF